jgi:hypothetical protein
VPVDNPVDKRNAPRWAETLPAEMAVDKEFLEDAAWLAVAPGVSGGGGDESVDVCRLPKRWRVGVSGLFPRAREPSVESGRQTEG